jgi:hypothetical protein
MSWVLGSTLEQFRSANQMGSEEVDGGRLRELDGHLEGRGKIHQSLGLWCVASSSAGIRGIPRTRPQCAQCVGILLAQHY